MQYNPRKSLDGHSGPYTHENLKSMHLAHQEALHMKHQAKKSHYGVLVELDGGPYGNLEAAYKAHEAGGNMSNVLHAMSTPHELQQLHMARSKEKVAQAHIMPKEKYNEET